MKKNLLSLLAALTVALVGTTVASADPISGSLGFAGTYSTDNNADFTAATKFTSFNAFVLTSSGDYSWVGVGTPVTFTPFSFTDSGVTPLWQLFGGWISFDATSVSVSTTTNSIIAQGGGIAHMVGYDDTYGSWILTSNGIGGAALTFSASTSVPDTGMTILLMGAAFLGLAVVTRRLKAVRA